MECVVDVCDKEVVGLLLHWLDDGAVFLHCLNPINHTIHGNHDPIAKLLFLEIVGAIDPVDLSDNNACQRDDSEDDYNIYRASLQDCNTTSLCKICGLFNIRLTMKRRCSQIWF